MKMFSEHFFVFALCCSHVICVLQHVSLSGYPDAVCSDGTPAAYYRSPRDKDDAHAPDNYVIFLEGGGYCHDVNACDWRCQMAPHLCTTPESETIQNSGILSDDAGINPYFHGYFKVDLPYCTSDMYVGRRFGSELTKGHHFQGHRVLTAMIQSLIADVRIDKAKRILFGGSSAGGAGVAFNCDYMKSLLPRSRIHCIVDAAFFYPETHPFSEDEPCESIDKVLAVGGVLWDSPEVSGFHLDGWWGDVRQDLLIGIARFDQFGLESFCHNETSERDLDTWGAAIGQIARDLRWRYPRVGLFMPGCIGHMMLNDDAAFGGLPVGERRLTYSDTAWNWVNGSRDIHVMDTCHDDQSGCQKYCRVN
ncbi:hypothetical protein LSH36_39g12014 [Paralvinella palmiformis]|uniref:Pectin acetylesterase n=1 Tax=Paralvinella palmiformis TaxID=53620 RepID=A0AAD9K867_9ANNE|nr:hypothetical protein LSH36_39g12014 [Paralvinella palmiformis]